MENQTYENNPGMKKVKFEWVEPDQLLVGNALQEYTKVVRYLKMLLNENAHLGETIQEQLIKINELSTKPKQSSKPKKEKK